MIPIFSHSYLLLSDTKTNEKEHKDWIHFEHK